MKSSRVYAWLYGKICTGLVTPLSHPWVQLVEITLLPFCFFFRHFSVLTLAVWVLHLIITIVLQVKGGTTDLKAVCELQPNVLSVSYYNISSILSSITSAVNRIYEKSGKFVLPRCVQNIYLIHNIYFYTHATRVPASIFELCHLINYVCNFAVKAECPLSRTPWCFCMPRVWICMEQKKF